MKKALLLILCTLTASLYAQTNEEKIQEKAYKAIQEMDNGNIEKALELLEECQNLDPDNIDISYEMAYAYYLDKQYTKAIKMLSKLTKHPEVNDKVYQMLGNSYDMAGTPKKAIASYDKGLKLFPNSGPLHLERGNMELSKENYNEALGYYEKGIYVDPNFPSNYYWATKLYLNSSEEVWGMLYGEIFMNIERNSKRTSEISKMLYDTYQKEIKFTSDSTASVSFSRQMSLNINNVTDTNDLKAPFSMIYETTMLLSIIYENAIDITSLDHIRTAFLDNYFKLGHAEKYPNVLFDYQKQIKDLGHLEAYNHWILMQGDEEGFENWYQANQDKWKNFIDWFKENPIQINDQNHFHSSQY